MTTGRKRSLNSRERVLAALAHEEPDRVPLDMGGGAATGLVGKEAELFRFTVKHSRLFAVVVGVITLLQAYVLTGMVPG